ncbi:MAG TPA: ATP-binding protein [Gaiellaceae bacterium]|jgi:signal transduction histidine kinase|nr:ATP-binding protein [Gaiellaceae bacterium]
MSEERGSLLVARALAASTSDPRTATVITEVCDELEALLETQATIGFDLHDGPLQSLAAVRLDLELFRSQIAGLTVGAAADVPLLGRVADIGARLSALEAELRDVAVGAMDDPGAVSLTVLIAELAFEAAGELRVELRLDPELDRLTLAEPQRLALARVVGAAVANAARHSGAPLIVVTAQLLSDSIEVEVVDTGAGFDLAGAAARANREGRLGLVGMKERMRRLGGELRVRSAVGEGTSVRARLPLSS